MGKIVSIHSFRGGTGKSNISANLATWCAMQGARVGVIDTDIQSPGVHVIFGLGGKKISPTLNDYLYHKCEIEECAQDITNQLGIKKGKVYIIPSSMEAEEIAKVLKEGYEISTLNQGFGELLEKLNLDFLIIDTHPGLEEETLLTTAISDILLVILRPDEQDYLGTAVTLEVAKKLEVPSIYLILNKVLEEYDFKEMKKEAEKAYGVKVAGILPFSEDLMKAGSKELFVLTLPEHKFSKEIAKIGEVLINNKYIEK